ncbi:MAG TPA: recombinase RecT [Halanaerobiales bacterium]|nr:recombinase RecT [Halanaerobiales bacterium]
MSSKGNDKVKNQLKEKKNNNPLGKKETIEMKVYQYIEKMKPEIEKVLPKHIGVERMSRIAFTTVRTTSDLVNCSMGSLMGSVMQASALGLEPNLLGQCYIIPYKNQATFILGYRGMINLARRSGEIQTLYAHVVKENDEFSYQYGLEPDLKHIPAEEERGKIKGAYMVAKFKDGGYYFEYMPIADILKRRDKSPAAKSEYSPWNDMGIGYEEMVKKTVIRHAFKYLPVSIEIMRNVELTDETQKDLKEFNKDDFIELKVDDISDRNVS